MSNAGDRAGVETVEVFVRDGLSPRVTPVRELKGFARVELDAGETETTQVTLEGEESGGRATTANGPRRRGASRCSPAI